MLQLNNIVKNYYLNDETVGALKGVSIKFRRSEFVSILGPSGCGKTTLLNIVGGLDRYTSGDLIINNKSTKKFSDKEWDTYRNHSVGFIFQSYNLIMHLTVLENVELALTLSGVSATERRKKATEVLKKVGLASKLKSKPNQLSGGQMQRVAIARALINDPEILLADEPTGALDSKTSTQIMELLKEIANDRLIIMVTHNPELAEQYSSRIIRLLDGELIEDSSPIKDDEKIAEKPVSTNNKTSMNFKTALSLSFKNLLTKKARSIMVSFAGSIGIIGIALILSLSSGFQNYINTMQEDTLSNYPVTITKVNTDMTSIMTGMPSQMEKPPKEFPDSTNITFDDSFSSMFEAMGSAVKTNDLASFMPALENYDTEKISAITYSYDINFNMYTENDKQLSDIMVTLSSVLNGFTNIPGGEQSSGQFNPGMIPPSKIYSQMLDNQEILDRQYELIGNSRWPSENAYGEVVLVVDKYNKVPDYMLANLGLINPNQLLYPMLTSMMGYDKMDPVQKAMIDAMLKTYGISQIPEDEIVTEYDINKDLIGKELKMLLDSDYYQKGENNIFTNVTSGEFIDTKLAQSATTLKIVGVVREVDNASITGSIGYTKALTDHLLDKINNAEVIVAQKATPEINVLDGLRFDADRTPTEDKTQTMFEQVYSYETNLALFGDANKNDPASISIYPTSFENKDYVIDLINSYNDKQTDEKKEISYTDFLGIMMSSITTIIDAISYILIGFVSISLVVSSLMIGIITYISVLERIKEIGILRSIGASKKDISRVFNAETLIIGFVAGVMGIAITLLLNIPINLIINLFADIGNVAKLPVLGGVVLIVISMVLTFIAGLIPANVASKKDPVIALRSE